MTDQDELRRVLAQIRAMRQNLSPEPDERDAERFHEQLDRLDREGYDVAEFRLDPERDMYRLLRTANRRTGETRYADVKSVNIGVLESKMDAVLGYFKLAERKESIGFTAPLKRD